MVHRYDALDLHAFKSGKTADQDQKGRSLSCANESEPLPACLSHQPVLPSNLSRHGHRIGDQGSAVRVIGPVLRREGRMLTDWSGLDRFCPRQRWRLSHDGRRGTCAVPRCLAVEVGALGDSTVSEWLLRRPWPVSGSAAGLLLTSWCAIHDFPWSLAWTPSVRRFTYGTAGQGSWMSSGPSALTLLPTEMLPAGSGGSGGPRRHGIRTSRCLWWRPRAQ